MRVVQTPASQDQLLRRLVLNLFLPLSAWFIFPLRPSPTKFTCALHLTMSLFKFFYPEPLDPGHDLSDALSRTCSSQPSEQHGLLQRFNK